MAVSVTMPRLGESVTEGTVTRWLKKEGERVEADEPLLEVSTDKVDTEIPSPAAGIVTSIKVQEDETVEVGVELAIIDDGAGAGEAAAPEAGVMCEWRHRTVRADSLALPQMRSACSNWWNIFVSRRPVSCSRHSAPTCGATGRLTVFR